MTDEQIKKALERCGQHRECCYCNSVEECGNKRVLTASALDLINRKDAEIERLQKAIKVQDIMINQMEHKLKTAKSEARKEFAERVNPIIEEIVDIMFDGNKPKCMIKNCHKHSSIPCESLTCIEENKAYWKVRIYNHVKEMVGDTDE